MGWNFHFTVLWENSGFEDVESFLVKSEWMNEKSFRTNSKNTQNVCLNCENLHIVAEHHYK
jgi:hypothetical protein